MASDLNTVIVIGRLTKEIELKSTQGGKSVASFSIANGYKYGETESTSFFNCVAWGKSAEALQKYTAKGHRIAVEGRLQQRSWKDKEGNTRQAVEIIVNSFQFLEPKRDNQPAPYAQPAPYTQQPSANTYPDSYDNVPLPEYTQTSNSFDDSDVPF